LQKRGGFFQISLHLHKEAGIKTGCKTARIPVYREKSLLGAPVIPGFDKRLSIVCLSSNRPVSGSFSLKPPPLGYCKRRQITAKLCHVSLN
jgi:hypothetical protein